MDYHNFGAIPQRALPLQGWTKYSIPGTEIPPPVSEPPPQGGMSVGGVSHDPEGAKREKSILRDDREIMEIIAATLQSGILD